MSKGWLVALIITSSGVAIANDAPVVDVTQPSAQATPAVSNTAEQLAPPATPMQQSADSTDQPQPQNVPLPQQVARLKQQVKNIINMDLAQQINQLQQQLQQLQGQLQVQAHDLKMLAQQQKSFYQDLDQRLASLQSRENTTATAAATSPQKNTAATAPSVSAKTKLTTKMANQPGVSSANAYRAAFTLLMQKQYPKAVSALTAYLKQYPKGRFVVNAHYWLGEIYSVQKQFAKASAEFQTVITQFPKSSKVPDAKLKIAMMQIAQGQTAQAKAGLMQLKQQYPNSTAAQLASIQLQQLQLAG